MSKLKAALLSLLIGTSSIAIAAPTLSFDMRHDEQVLVDPMPVNQWTSWISLGAPMTMLDGKGEQAHVGELRKGWTRHGPSRRAHLHAR